ncbi:hypothetical protein [Streptomyces sp. ISBFB 2968]|uniref:hypothetical protein n=1 Tax=Streptomyces sp. ISBFB 2968 TaxID=2903527 RepID=UPI002FDC7285
MRGPRPRGPRPRQGPRRRDADVRKSAVLAPTRHTDAAEDAGTALATATGDTDAAGRAYATRAL